MSFFFELFFCCYGQLIFIETTLQYFYKIYFSKSFMNSYLYSRQIVNVIYKCNYIREPKIEQNFFKNKMLTLKMSYGDSIRMCRKY